MRRGGNKHPDEDEPTPVRLPEAVAMKAIVYHEYGSPENLALQDVEMPAIKDDEVLVKVHAASVNWLDWHFLTGTPFMARIMAGGFLKPGNKILGIDLAGRVEAVGTNVSQLQLGDEVILEMTQIGKECHAACAIRQQVGDCIMPREGVFGRVIRGGHVSPGDSIRVAE